MSTLPRFDPLPQLSQPASAVVVDRWYSEKRLGGLSRFAVAITVLNIAGHAFLGFEQPWIVPLAALAAAYAADLLAEWVEARMQRRTARFAGSFVALVRFLLPAHITALAVSMLTYAADQIWPIVFAVVVAIASKHLFRVRVSSGPVGAPATRHFLNPSNFGIAVALLAFPWVGIAPAYHFTENTSGIVDWLLPLIVIGTGSYLNTKATGRVPLIAAWLVAFAAQALLRAAFHGAPWNAGLMPMTGFAFILFTFYMITDPATTPVQPARQALFAAAVAGVYALLMELHVVFAIFHALGIVTAGRGLLLWLAPKLKAASAGAAVTVR